MKCIPTSLKKTQKDHFDQIKDKVQRRLNWEVERPDIMSYVIQHNDKNEGMTLGEIQATFMILTTAGSETTATALSGILNYLTTIDNREVMFTLIGEIRDAFTSEDEIKLDKLNDLPYLNAVISEGLRLCPPIPIMLPRIVPEGGDTVCGMWLPAGVSLLSQSINEVINKNYRRVFLCNNGPCFAILIFFTSLYRFIQNVGFLTRRIQLLHFLKINDKLFNLLVLDLDHA